MKRLLAILAAGAAVLVLSCKKSGVENLTYEVVTLGSEMEASSVTLSGKVGPDLDVASVTEVGFLVSEDDKFPDDNVKVFPGGLSGKEFSRTVKVSDLENKRGVVFYYRAYAVGDGKQYTGAVKSFKFDPIKVTGIVLNSYTLGLVVGESRTLVATVQPSDASNKDVVWSSSNEKVATVDKGVVTAKAKGEATIFVKSAADSNMGTSCKVTVKGACPQGAVDLGLSVYWAATNLTKSGLASRASDTGDKFAWGETAPKSYYDASNYKFGSSGDKLTKYNKSDKKAELDLSDDAANVILHGNWRIPSSENFRELWDNCTRQKVTSNSVNCVRFTSKINGKSIDIPAWYETTISSALISYSDYWLRDREWSSVDDWNYRANRFRVNPGALNNMDLSFGGRQNGYPIRPVSD